MLRANFFRTVIGAPLAAVVATKLGANNIIRPQDGFRDPPVEISIPGHPSDEDILLAVELKNITEEVVGEVGPATNTRYAATGEEVIEYALAYRDIKRGRIALKEWWGNTVLNLRREAVSRDIAARLILSPTLYWRRTPKINGHEYPGFKTFRARLLVSCSPTDNRR